MDSAIVELQSLAVSGDPKRILQLLDQLRKGSSSTLAELFTLINDDYDGQIVFPIVHALESMPRLLYLQYFLKFVDMIYLNSQRWSAILFVRIYNDPESFNMMISLLEEQPEKYDIMKKIRIAALDLRSDLPDLVKNIA